jgi:DNA-binding NarL/FixJ family response regulator
MSRRIFIVDDHVAVREIYTLFFEEAGGLEVCGAVATAEEALQNVPNCSPDLVIIDVSLPGMNGIDLVRRLRQENAGIRLLVISGHDELRYAGPAREAGADGFVRKGNAEAVLEAVDALLEGNLYFPGTIANGR